MNEYPLRERDLSWLRFNERVLQEAMDQSVPLYERINFLAIFSSNLDEFFNVRVSALRQFKELRKAERRSYDLRPTRTLKEIMKEVHRQQDLFGAVIRTEILPQLASEGVYLISRSSYTRTQKSKALKYYQDHLKGYIEYRILDQGEPMPYIKNHEIYLVFAVKDSGLGIARVPVEEFGRFIMINQTRDKMHVTFIEDVIITGMKDELGEALEEFGSIKMSRDLETYIEDEFSGDLIEKIKIAITKREEGLPTRLLYERQMTEGFTERIQEVFGLNKADMIAGGSYHNFSDFFSFPKPSGHRPHLTYEDMPPLPHPRLAQCASIIDHLQGRDEILHFPYQKFSYIPQLLHEAGDMPEVREIKITLYRISKTSDVANALLYALQRGKKVVIFIEAKARFDEENNLTWGAELEAHGAKVIYSYPGIKIHTKICLIRMQGKSQMKDIGYIGTGNFNEKTARLYCDHALLTSNVDISKDINQVFYVLQRKVIVPNLRQLVVSPFTSRQRFTKMIERAIKARKKGRPAKLILKMNSLEDADMIHKLYDASMQGVEVRLLVRGLCCLISGMEVLSEHIYTTSIIDRYLEHARVYYFSDGKNEELIMGSADWMSRNLDRRIEVLTPILDKEIKREMLKMLELQTMDNVKSRIIDSNELNEYVTSADGSKEVRSQTAFYHYLSGKLGAEDPHGLSPLRS